MTFGFEGADFCSLLGIRSGMHVSVIHPPDGFLEALLPLPEGAALLDTARLGLDVVVFFTQKKTELVERLPHLVQAMSVTGAIWVVFPAEAATVASLAPGEDFVRLAALELGLTDTKVLLLDAQWKGLRLQWKPRAPRVELPGARA